MCFPCLYLVRSARCFLAEMTENIILILQCSDTNEKQNLPVDTVYRTVLMPPHSGVQVTAPCPIWFPVPAFPVGSVLCSLRQPRGDCGSGAMEMGHSETLQLPNWEPPANPCISAHATVCQINPFHGSAHSEWRLLKLFGTQDQFSRWARCASEKGNKLKKLPLPLAV